MPIFPVVENYNGTENNLNSNVGKWVPASFTFIHRVDFFSEKDMNNTVTYFVVGSGGVQSQWLELNNGQNWKDLGFTEGLSINVTLSTPIPTPLLVNQNVNINSIDDNKMYIDAELLAGGTTPLVNNTQAPNIDASGQVFGLIKVVCLTAPEELQYDFNLTNIDAPSLESLIDGSVNRFRFNGVDGLSVGGSAVMTQINNKSGGYFQDVTLEYLAESDNYRQYKVSFNFFNWAMLQSGFSEPNWFEGVSTIGGIHRVNMLTIQGDNGSALEYLTSGNSGNVGGFDENYNTSEAGYTLNNIEFTNLAGDPIDGLDYTNTCKFEAVINDPFGRLDITNSRFNIGMAWRTIETDEYYTNTNTFGKNTLILAPLNNFSHATTPNPTQYNGNNNNGVNWAFKNLQFTVGGGVLTVTGEIIPGVNNDAFFSELDDGERLLSLWVAPFRIDYANVDRFDTSVLIYNDDAISAPVLGNPLNVVSSNFFDHALINISDSLTLTTTEDDTNFNVNFRLLKDNVYTSLTAKIEMYNSLTGDRFTVESFTIPFNNIPFVGGIHQFNQVIPRNFNLPPDSTFNDIDLSLDNTSTATDYGVNLNYGWLNRWEYWLPQDNADLHFFDLNEPNNGLNKNWRYYALDPDWSPQFMILVEKDDISDFFSRPFNIRRYEDEDCTTVCTFTNLEDGSNPEVLVANTQIQVDAVITWNTGVFEASQLWAESTIEDFESGNRWVLSSYLDQGNVNLNPLKPLDGLTKLQVVIVGNVATLTYIIDTNILTSTSVSISHRIHSLDDNLQGKIYEDGTQKLMEDGTNKQLEQ